MDDFSELAGAALVFGGSGGIGLAVVRLLAQRGSDVALTWHAAEKEAAWVAEEAATYGVRVSTHQLDGTDALACTGVVEAAVERHGGLHTLVCAAGPPIPMTHLSVVDPATMTDHLRDDAGAFFNVVSAALPALREEGGGSIVAITTAATSRFPVRDGLSSAPKAAVEALARELRGSGDAHRRHGRPADDER
jgi:3-oxoacyl-[acyl-carrier protein] reductase